VYSIRNILIGIYQKRNKNMSDKRISSLDLRAMGSRIRALRGEVLQEELAGKIGISQGQLSKIESGRLAPTLETLVRLANEFGKSLDWIVTGKK
jgi:DNA-binding XRE family transcriptional regulator